MNLSLTREQAEFVAEIIRHRPISLPDEDAVKCVTISREIYRQIEADLQAQFPCVDIKPLVDETAPAPTKEQWDSLTKIPPPPP